MMYLRVCPVRGAWKDGSVRAARMLQREELLQQTLSKPFQLGFVCLVSTVSLSGIILFGSRYSSLLASDLRRSCTLSELAMLTGQRSTGWYIQEECHMEKSLSRTVFQLDFIFLLLSVSFPLNDSLTLRYSSPIAILLWCCCLIPGMLCSPARRYRPVCSERVPQRGGASPVSCSSTVSCFRHRRIA